MKNGHEAHRDPAGDDGYVYRLAGGHPALDFANTVGRRVAPVPNVERMPTYGRLVSWSLQAGLLAGKEAQRLREAARERPRAAAAALKEAIALRERIFSIFIAAARGENPPAAAVDALNEALPKALGSLRVSSGREGFSLRFVHGPENLTPMLAPVVRGAAELLTSEDDLRRVRECGADTCFWLFLDRSKNGTRRWCDMKICGNRAKARRHHARAKSGASKKRQTA